MNQNIKYNIGDKVIKLDLRYFQNPYHYKSCIKEYSVLDADEKYFSPFYEKYDRFFSGSNLFSICDQTYGVAMHGGDRFYHKEKDREFILSEINNAIKEYDKMCSYSDSNRISELELIIENAKKEIDQIKKGEGSWKVGFSRLNNHEYKTKVLKIIEKVFPINH